MATKEEVLAAIQAEKEQVLTAVSDLNTQIQALKNQIAQGSAVTPADLDGIIAAVNNIFVPTADQQEAPAPTTDTPSSEAPAA